MVVVLLFVFRFERQDLGISLVVDVRDVSEDVLQRMMSALRMLHVS